MSSLSDDRGAARRRLNTKSANHCLRHGIGVGIHRPIHVYLQIASACNLDCYMCSEHLRPEELRHGKGMISFPPDLFARIEEEVFPYSTHLHLGVGGEPTLSDHFTDFVERASNAGQTIHLTTNGTRFGQAKTAEIVARHVAHVQLSIDAASEATYERIRVGSKWTRLLKNIDLYNQHRDATPPSERSHLTICFVLMRSNIEELPAFVELAHEIRADHVYAQHVIPVTDEGKEESLILDPKQYNAVQAKTVDVAESLGVSLQIPGPYTKADMEAPTPHVEAQALLGVEFDPGVPRTEESGVIEPVLPTEAAPVEQGVALERPEPLGVGVPCTLPAQAVYVLYDGRVFPCCHPYAHQKMQMGDLRTQTFGEIWNNRLYRNLRAGMSTGNVPTICRNCSLVHDPPPAFEDPDELTNSLDIAGYYGEEDLAPLSTAARSDDPLRWMENTRWQPFFVELMEHAENLEEELPALRAHNDDLEREQRALREHAAALESQREEYRNSSITESVRGVVRAIYRKLRKSARDG